MMNFKKSSILALAAIMSFRMLGLFMILPIFSLYTATLKGANPTLIGLALGIYGLMQACFQIPLGLLSDRWGRKPIIASGLLIFVVGSVIAALSHTIFGIILGRALQGAGAVGSAILALVADLTPDEDRTKAMALMGITIGFSFLLAMILGPLINATFHLSGIFWIAAVMGMTGILFLFWLIPQPPHLVTHQDVETVPSQLKNVLKNTQLLRLNLGICVLHSILTALFVAIPMLLTNQLQLSEHHQTA